MNKSETTYKRFRLLSWAEGISFLLLLGVAMPLKYAMDMPLAVSVVGMIHGALFVAYLGFAYYMKELKLLSFKEMMIAGVASILPFGMIYLDKKVLSAHI